LNNTVLLEVKDLTIGFQSGDEIISITDSISFTIHKGEIFGLVGESGCGKTVTALSILRLLPKPGAVIQSGSIVLQGTDLLSLSPDKMQRFRGSEISMIFQEPAAALNPLLTIRKQLMETFQYHTSKEAPMDRINTLLKRVGFASPTRVLQSYPHELSGGMLQRVMIAQALMLKPALIIADEPTTALDVTVQAQIMELLIELCTQEQSSILFITHNLNLIAQYADRLAVMYAGRIVEESPLEPFLENQYHPYSKGLIAALPDLDQTHAVLTPIRGQVPQPKEYPPGCRFRERCEHAFDRCIHTPPSFQIAANRSASCFLYEKDHLTENTDNAHS